MLEAEVRAWLDDARRDNAALPVWQVGSGNAVRKQTVLQQTVLQQPYLEGWLHTQWAQAPPLPFNLEYSYDKIIRVRAQPRVFVPPLAGGLRSIH